MSTVIIGGGGDARAAIDALEAASLSMTQPQRDEAELRLKVFSSDTMAFAEACQ
jgi:hypothetical protein